MMESPRELAEAVDAALAGLGCNVAELRAALNRARKGMLDLLRVPPPSASSRQEIATMHPQTPIGRVRLDAGDVQQVYLLSDALHLDEVSALLALVTAHDERGSATAEAAAGVFFDERAAVARTLHALLSAAAVPSDATPTAVAAVAAAFVRDLLAVTAEEGEAGGKRGTRCALIKRLVEVVDDASLEPEEEDEGGMAAVLPAVPSSATLPAALGGAVVAAAAASASQQRQQQQQQQPRRAPSLLSLVVDARGCEVDRRSLVAAERATLCECLLFAVRLRRTLGPADAAAVVDLARVTALRARFARRQQQLQQGQQAQGQGQLQQQQRQRGGGGNGGQQLLSLEGGDAPSGPLPAPAAVTLQHAHVAALAAVAALLPSAAAAPLSAAGGAGAGGNGDEHETSAAAAAAASAAAAEDDAALSALASDAALSAKLDASAAAGGGGAASAAAAPPPPFSMLSPHSQYHHSSHPPPSTSTDDESLAAILRVSWGALLSLHGPATASARERADAAVSSGLEAGALRSLAGLLRSPELAADAAPSARRAGAAAAHDALAALLESDAGRDAVSDLAARSSERAALAAEAEEAAAAAAAREAEQASAAAAGLYLPGDGFGGTAASAAATPFASSSSALDQGDFADPAPDADGLEHVLDLLAACLSTAPELWLDGGLRAGVVAEFLEYCASHPVLCEAPEALAAYTRVLCSVARGGAGGAAAVLNQLRSGSGGAGGGSAAAVSWRQGFGAMIAYCERYSGPSSASASAAAAEAAAANAVNAVNAALLYGGGSSVDIYGNPIPNQQLLQQQQQANAPSTTTQPSELAVPDSDAEGMAAYARLAAAVLRSAPRSEAAAWRAALEAEAGGVPLAELALQLMCHPVPQHLKAALDGLLEALAREPGAALPLLDRLALVLLAPRDGGRGGGGGGGAAAALAPATFGYLSDLASLPRQNGGGGAGGNSSSSMPRYDVSYQLSEVEARSEDYCETLALVRLLTTALRRAAAATASAAGGGGCGTGGGGAAASASASPSSSASSFLPDGGVHYAHLASFVRRDVLGTVLVRGFADQAQRWRLASAALDHAAEWLALARGNPSAALDARRWASGSRQQQGQQQQGQQGFASDAANAMALYGAVAGAAAAGTRFSAPSSTGPLPPALETMLDLLSEGEAFRVALAVLAPGADALAAEARARVAVGAARERAVRSALRLLRLGLQLDVAALAAARAAGLLGGGGGGGGARASSSSSSSSSSIYQPLDRALRRELWRVPALLDYCRYAPDPGIQAEALRLARELSPRLRGPAAVDALLQAGAVGLLQQQQQQQQQVFQQQQQQQQYSYYQQQQGGGSQPGMPPLPPSPCAPRTPTPPADRVRDGFAACLTDGLFGAGARPRAVEDLWWWDDGGSDNGGWGSDDDEQKASDENDDDGDGGGDGGGDGPSSSRFRCSRDPRARLVLDVLLDSAGADASLSPSLAHLLLGYDVRRGPAGLAASTLDARFGGACAAPLLRAALTPALSDADPEAAAAVLEVFVRLASSPAPWRGGSGAGGPARALLRQARVVPLRLAALAADVRGGGGGGGSIEARTAALLLRLAGEELLRASGPDDQKSASAAAAAAAAVGASSRKAAAAAAAAAADAHGAASATGAGGGAGSPSRRSSASLPTSAAAAADDDDDASAGVDDLAAALLDRGTGLGESSNEGAAAPASSPSTGELAASALLSLLSSAAMEPPVLFSGSSISSSHAIREAGAALGVEEVLSACCSTAVVAAPSASASAAATSFAVFDVAAVAAELEARLSDFGAEAGTAAAAMATAAAAAAASAPSATSRAACRAALEYAAAHNAWAAATASAGEVAAAWAGAIGLLFGRRFGAVCRAAAAAEARAASSPPSSALSPPSSSNVDPDAGAALAVELASRALQAAAACLPRDAARAAPTLARAARSLLSRAREVCARSVGAPGEGPSRARSPAVLRGLLADALDALKRARGGGAPDGGSSQQQQQSLQRGNAVVREALHGCLLEILRLAAPRAASSSLCPSSSAASVAVADALVASAPGGPAAGAAARDAEERTQAAIERATAVALAAAPGLVEGLAADALASSGGSGSGFSNSSSSAPARLTALALLAELLAPAARDGGGGGDASSFYYGDDDASAAATARLQIAAAVAASGLPSRLASALASVHPLALVAGGGVDGRGGGGSSNSGVVAALEVEASLALLLRLAQSGGAIAAGGSYDSSSSSASLYGSGLNEAAAAASAELNALSRCAALDLEPEDPVVGTGGGGRGFGVGRSSGGGAAAAASSSSFAAAPRPGSARAALARVLPPALRLVLVRLHVGSGNGRRGPSRSTAAAATTVTAAPEVVAAAAAFVAAHRGALVRVLLEAGAPAGAGGWEPSPQDLDTASLVLNLLTALRGASAAASAAASSPSSSATAAFAPRLAAAASEAELDALASLHGAAPELRAAALRLAARFFRVDARSDAPGPLRLAAARDEIGNGSGGGGGRRGTSSGTGGGGGNALALFDDNSASAASKKGPSAEERRALDALAAAVLRVRLATARFVLGECAGHGLVLAAAPPPAGLVASGGIGARGGRNAGRLSLVSVKDALFQCVENLMAASDARERALAAVRDASGRGRGAENDSGLGGGGFAAAAAANLLPSSNSTASAGVSPELLAAASAADAATRKLLTLVEVCLGTVYVCVVGGGSGGGGAGAERASAAGSRADLAQLGRLLSPVLDALGRGPLSSSGRSPAAGGAGAAAAPSSSFMATMRGGGASRAEALAALARRVEVALSPSR